MPAPVDPEMEPVNRPTNYEYNRRGGMSRRSKKSKRTKRKTRRR
jgi:hypothetical protein